MIRLFLASVLCSLMLGCTSIPKGVEPVAPFSLDRYLGTWYEMYRLDHRFERGLQQVTAEYSLRDDGRIRVINSGYRVAEQCWERIEGVARPVNNTGDGHLKVSFFGPFYGSYVVASIDDAYQLSLVTGPNRRFLWILARDPGVSAERLDSLLAKAESLGFDRGALIKVDHAETQAADSAAAPVVTDAASEAC